MTGTITEGEGRSAGCACAARTRTASTHGCVDGGSSEWIFRSIPSSKSEFGVECATSSVTSMGLVAPVAALLCALLAASALLGAQQRIEAAFQLRHGVLVDRSAQAIYLGAPRGGIEAVQVSNGRSLWTSAAASIPLAVNGRLLLAQAVDPQPGERLPLVLLDVVAKGRKARDVVLPLPGGVRAFGSDTLEQSFRASARPDGNRFLVFWSYSETVVQGIARTPDEAPPPTRRLAGAARLNPLDGTIVPITRAPDAIDAARDPIAERVMSANALPHLPWRVDNELVFQEGGRGGSMRLKRWDARNGRSLPDVALMDRAITSLLSVDRTHLLVSERVGAGGPADPEYRWSIFRLPQGRGVGSVRHDTSALPFFIWRDSLLFESPPRGFLSAGIWREEPLSIVAVRLTTSDVIWSRAIRDAEYRGPVPPSKK